MKWLIRLVIRDDVLKRPVEDSGQDSKTTTELYHLYTQDGKRDEIKKDKTYRQVKRMVS